MNLAILVNKGILAMKISGNMSFWKVSLIMPLILLAVLAPFSWLIGWNLLTAFLFWFIIIPALTLYLPVKISRNRNHLLESLFGLLIFYGFMVYMIYDHYQTDHFKVMIVSGMVNILMISIISIIRQRKQVNTVS